MTVKITLKQVRKARNLSQNKLAQRIGMTLQTVQRIEYGDAKSIPLDTLDKLCEVLDCQTGDLLVRVPNDDEEQFNLIVEQIIRGLKPMDNKGEINSATSSHFKGSSPSCLKSLSQLPKSA